MKFLEHISASMSKFSSMYSNQLVTPVESTMFERICQVSKSLKIFIYLPRSLNYTSTYLNFNIEYKDRAKISHKKMHTIKSLEANNMNSLIYSKKEKTIEYSFLVHQQQKTIECVKKISLHINIVLYLSFPSPLVLG